MKFTARRVVTAAFVVGSAALGFAPLAAAATTTTLTPSAEGWYQPNPSCKGPAGCATTGALPAQPPTKPATSPYPVGSLHIAVDAGQEVARSYLGLPLSSLTGAVAAGSLTIPLDTAPADGSNAPETAKIQVCVVRGSVVKADGSFDTPPIVDCAVSAPISYVATPQPHLKADLTKLAAGLSGASGLALLPDATKVAQTDTWRVVFSAHDRADAAKTAPASVILTLTDAPAELPFDSGTAPLAPAPELGGITAPVGTAFAPAPSTKIPTTAAIAPTVTTPVTAPVAAPRTITVGYAYPAVWLLPLAFLVLVPAAARALTKDLTVA